MKKQLVSYPKLVSKYKKKAKEIMLLRQLATDNSINQIIVWNRAGQTHTSLKKLDNQSNQRFNGLSFVGGYFIQVVQSSAAV